MCIIVAARDDVIAGDMEASCEAAKKTKIEHTETTGTCQYRIAGIRVG